MTKPEAVLAALRGEQLVLSVKRPNKRRSINCLLLECGHTDYSISDRAEGDYVICWQCRDLLAMSMGEIVVDKQQAVLASLREPLMRMAWNKRVNAKGKVYVQLSCGHVASFALATIRWDTTNSFHYVDCTECG